MIHTKNDIDLRIALCEMVLRWLRSDDPILKESENASLVPAAIENYTGQLEELRKMKAEASSVTVGLKGAKLTPKIIGG